jgi:hypothetical protein
MHGVTAPAPQRWFKLQCRMLYLLNLVHVDLSDPEEDHVEGQGRAQQELQHRPQEVVGVETVALL